MDRRDGLEQRPIAGLVQSAHPGWDGLRLPAAQGVTPFNPLLNATPFTAAASWIAYWK
jgi:hypothetical protein